jgi:hypothetical protein
MGSQQEAILAFWGKALTRVTLDAHVKALLPAKSLSYLENIGFPDPKKTSRPLRINFNHTIDEEKVHHFNGNKYILFRQNWPEYMGIEVETGKIWVIFQLELPPEEKYREKLTYVNRDIETYMFFLIMYLEQKSELGRVFAEADAALPDKSQLERASIETFALERQAEIINQLREKYAAIELEALNEKSWWWWKLFELEAIG